MYNGSYGVATDSNGLYYMRARYYNPDIKRFINQDIKVGDIGNSQSLNRYAYCEGNPVNMVDPFGLCPDPANGDRNELLSFGAHLLLGLGGMIPGLGFVFDLADAALCYYENDTVGMALLLASAIPFSGLMVGAGKLGRQTLKFGGYLSDVIRRLGKMARFADKTADIAKSARTLLRSGIPEKFAAFTLKGEKAAKILQKGGDALKDVGRIMRHQGEKIYSSAKNVAKRLKGGKITEDIYDLYRKASNTGEFKDLDELMQLKNVKNVANEAGIGLDGIKINRNSELLGKGVYGFTDGKTIILYPDELTDTETLVKTLGHERMHVYQVSVFGKATSTEILEEFEKAAYNSEKNWWDYYNFMNGGK